MNLGAAEYIMRYENEVLQLLPDKIQPLTRCKDCKRRKTRKCRIYDGYMFDNTEDEFFCADGERNDT